MIKSICLQCKSEIEDKKERKFCDRGCWSRYYSSIAGTTSYLRHGSMQDLYKINTPERGRKGAMASKIWERVTHKGLNPEFAKYARRELKKAVQKGTIRKESCKVCGSEIRVAGHHHDYSKPLDVEWLCNKHHSWFHIH